MRKNNNQKNQAGFSLVELMITITITLIVATSIVPLMLFVTQGSISNQSNMTASNLASNIMEEIRALDYDEVGTQGGNPAGSIPQLQENIEFNGAKFNVETLISWGTATGKSNKENVVAYKNVRVIVKGKNTFTGEERKMAELHSVITRDGESPLIKNGHIRARVYNAAEEPIGDPPIHIELTSPVVQKLVTDYSGTALFGILNAGTYKIRAKIEEGLFTLTRNDVQDGWIQKNNIVVENEKITDVEFFMEKKSNACFLEIRLLDTETGKAVTAGGKASLYLNLKGVEYPIYENKIFNAGDFEDEYLPTGFSGYLWPVGEYRLKISNVNDYPDYDMSIDFNPILENGIDFWDGTFDGPGTTLRITVPLNVNYFYRETSKEDFENSTEMEKVIALNDDTLQLDYHGDNVDNEIEHVSNSPAQGNNDPDSPFNGKHWTSESDPTEDDPVQIQCELEEVILLRRILVDISNNKNKLPGDFSVEVSIDGEDWNEVKTGTFPKAPKSIYAIEFDPPVQARFIRLIVTSRLDSPTNNNDMGVRFNNIDIVASSGRYSSGYRNSKPISLSAYWFAPKLVIKWQAVVPEGTTLKVYTAVTNNVNPPGPSAYREAVNGWPIPNIGYMEFIYGKYLWIKEVFTTNDEDLSPVLNRLHILEDEW